MGEQYSILERAKEGDNEAISELYSQNYYAVLGAIRSLVSDQDESMDLLQDAFLKAFANLDQLRGDFTPWAKRIAVNTAKDYLRKKKPILFTQMEGDDTDTGTPIEESFGQESAEGRPETILDSQETERLLGEILGSLPEEQRIVTNLCYYQEMSYKEISETLGIPENLVRSRLNLGREKVKKQVLALEKKGTKLYGLAPIPFLMFLYRSIEADAAGARPDASSIQEFLGALEGAGNTAPIAGAASPDPGTSIGSMAAKASVPAGVKASIAACTLAAVVGGSVFLAGMIPQKQEQALTPERIEYYSSEGELVQVMEYDPDTPFQTNNALMHHLKGNGKLWNTDTTAKGI